MTLNELQIDDVFEYGSYKLKLKYISPQWFISDVISSNEFIQSKKLYIPRAMYTLDQYQCKLISRNNMQNPIQEIQSLKIELQNIQNRIQKLEEENQLELGSIYEIHYQGNIIKGCLVEDLKNCYRFITRTSALYNLEKKLITSFKKLPDESVKQFFKKDSK